MSDDFLTPEQQRLQERADERLNKFFEETEYFKRKVKRGYDNVKKDSPAWHALSGATGLILLYEYVRKNDALRLVYYEDEIKHLNARIKALEQKNNS